MNYENYLIKKRSISGNHGFKPTYMPDQLKDFQSFLVDWTVRKGRSANLADCGLGKSFMELVWAQNVVRHTNKNVLLVTPIAVGGQMIKESEKFGIDDCSRSRDGEIKSKITITNYERLHYFSPNDFTGMILDESSILKNFKGATKNQINIFMRKLPYRLLATATAARG